MSVPVRLYTVREDCHARPASTPVDFAKQPKESVWACGVRCTLSLVLSWDLLWPAPMTNSMLKQMRTASFFDAYVQHGRWQSCHAKPCAQAATGSCQGHYIFNVPQHKGVLVLGKLKDLYCSRLWNQSSDQAVTALKATRNTQGKVQSCTCVDVLTEASVVHL